MDTFTTIRDEDLKAQLKGLHSGMIGYKTLVENLAKTQQERDAERRLSPVVRRRVNVRKELNTDAFEHEDRHHIHSVLALCGLPYRQVEAGTRDYIREYGRNSLVIQSGYLKNPMTGKMEAQGLPYGPKARLLLLHICTMALRQGGPEIEIADSMSAFIRDLGFPVTGGARGTITQFKEQLNRLAAARMQIGLWQGERSSTINAQPIESFDVWLPRSADQKMLWNSNLRLDQKFYQSLKEHALPVDIRALRAFSQSAKQIDMVLWLGYRLRTVSKPYPISWEALRAQFGTHVFRLRKFREEFLKDLEAIREVFPALPIKASEEGIMLFPSDPAALFVTSKRSLSAS